MVGTDAKQDAKDYARVKANNSWRVFGQDNQRAFLAWSFVRWGVVLLFYFSRNNTRLPSSYAVPSTVLSVCFSLFFFKKLQFFIKYGKTGKFFINNCQIEVVDAFHFALKLKNENKNCESRLRPRIRWPIFWIFLKSRHLMSLKVIFTGINKLKSNIRIILPGNHGGKIE